MKIVRKRIVALGENLSTGRYRASCRISLRKNRRLMALLAAIACPLFAGEFEAGLTGIADNREANSTIQKPGTIFGARGFAEYGATIDGAHRMRAGVSYLKEFGRKERWDNAALILYYRYRRDPFLFFIGSFPRRDILRYPEFLLCDSLSYYRPNIEGSFFEISFPRGRKNIWIDWTAQKTKEQREAFLTGCSGDFSFGTVVVSHYFLYYHLAHRAHKLPGEHVTDNGGGLLRVRKFFSAIGPVDSLSLCLDGMVSFDRVRGSTSWRTPAGMEASVAVRAGLFGGRAAYYRSVYDDAGSRHALRWGTVYYRAQEFAQFDLSFYPRMSKRVNASFDFSFYLVENRLDTRQRFLLNFGMEKNR